MRPYLHRRRFTLSLVLAYRRCTAAARTLRAHHRAAREYVVTHKRVAHLLSRDMQRTRPHIVALSHGASMTATSAEQALQEWLRAMELDTNKAPWETWVQYFDQLPPQVLRTVGEMWTPVERAACAQIRERRRRYAERMAPESLSARVQRISHPTWWQACVAELEGEDEDDEEDEDTGHDTPPRAAAATRIRATAVDEPILPAEADRYEPRDLLSTQGPAAQLHAEYQRAIHQEAPAIERHIPTPLVDAFQQRVWHAFCWGKVRRQAHS